MSNIRGYTGGLGVPVLGSLVSKLYYKGVYSVG
jgi:hypothetical protein